MMMYAKAVFDYLKTYVSTLRLNQIEMIPIEKIRIVWKDSSATISSDYQLASGWKTVTNLPKSMWFKFFSYDQKTCIELETMMTESPESFNCLEIEFVVTAQKSAVRKLSVHGEHIKKTSLSTKLQNMQVEGPVRY